MSIKAGQTISVTTSIVESHTHDFSLVEGAMAIVPTPSNPGPY
jgi:hypothetical protein